MGHPHLAEYFLLETIGGLVRWTQTGVDGYLILGLLLHVLESLLEQVYPLEHLLFELFVHLGVLLEE